MIDFKPKITQALRSNAELVSLLGGKKVWAQVAPAETNKPYITFFEITNFDKWFVDDLARASEIHMQVDVWSPSNTGAIASEVDKTMKSIGFTRSGSADLYEQDTKTYHKVLRYKIISMGVD